MGKEYYLITIIGVRVSNEKIMVRKNRPPTNHCTCNPQVDPAQHQYKYCPRCGNHLRIIHTKIVSKFESINPYDDKSELLGWPVANDTNAENFFIGVYSSGMVDYQKREDIPDLSKEVLDKFRKDMKLLGLWNEKEFGIWTVLCYCY